MLITYKGKEYFCRTFESGKIELRSNKYEDDTFQYSDGLYIKYVDKSECEKLKYIWIFAMYKNESIEVFRMDSHSNQILLTAGSSYEYSDEFIKKVLDGKVGRDISAWCDIDVFSSFFMITEEDVTKEERKIFLDTERAKEFIGLMRPETWRKR